MNVEVWLATLVNAILLFFIGLIAKKYFKDTVEGLNDLKKKFKILEQSVDITLQNEIRLLNQRFTNFDKNLWVQLKLLKETLLENTLILKRRKSEIEEIVKKQSQVETNLNKSNEVTNTLIKVAKKHNYRIEEIGKDVIILKEGRDE